MERFAAVDCKIANLNHSSICSIGIVWVEDDEVDDTFYSLVRPAPNYFSTQMRVTYGLSEQLTATAGDFPTVWAKVAPRLANIPLVAYGSSYVQDCIRAAHRYYHMDYPGYEFYCIRQLARENYPILPAYDIRTVSEYIGLDLEVHNHALQDAEACAELAIYFSEGAETWNELFLTYRREP